MHTMHFIALLSIFLDSLIKQLGVIRVLSRKAILLYSILYAVSHVSNAHDTAPQLHFDHYDKNDGLAHGTIWSILEDHLGFIWLGTNEGLVRFDGNRFLTYNNRDNDPTSISENTVLSLLEDYQHRMWVGTKDGLNIYNHFTDEFETISDSLSLKSNYFTTLLEDSRRNIWIGTSNGLYKLNPNSRELKQYFNFSGSEEKTSAYILSLAEDKLGDIWVGTQGQGLSRIDVSTDIVHPIGMVNSDSDGISNSNVRCLFVDFKGQLWIGTESGLDRYDPVSQTFAHFYSDQDGTLPDNHILSISQNEKGKLWVGTDDGLAIYDEETTTFAAYRHDVFDQQSLRDNVIRTLYTDSKGDLWIGQLKGSLSYLSNHSTSFRHVFNHPLMHETLVDNEVHCFLNGSDGIIWVGTEGGLCRYEMDINHSSVFKHNASDPTSISADEILSMLTDSKGRIWVGTLFGGLNLFDEQEGTFEHFNPDPENPNSLGKAFIWDILEDVDGSLWLATNGGLHRFDPATRRIDRYLHDPDNENSIGHNRVTDLVKYGDGIWVGTEFGLSKYIREENRFITYRRMVEDASSIRANIISCMYVDSKGNFWIGTKGGGLNLYDEKTDAFRVYSLDERQDLKNIYAIAEDDAGYLWITTNSGLYKFDTERKLTVPFTDDFSHLITPFKRNSIIKLSSGVMAIGGSGGFIMFDPAMSNVIKENYPLRLTQIDVLYKKLNAGSEEMRDHITSAKEVNLSYNQNVISIEYALLNYKSPHKNQYAFKLEPYQKEWEYVGTRKKAIYTNLDPGKYVFHVKAASDGDIWNEEQASIQIIITPPFWATWWFRSLIALLILRFVYVIFRFSNRLILKHSESLEKEVNDRKLAQEALLENEARTNLLLNSAFDGIVIYRKDKIVQFNQAFSDMFAVGEKDIANLSIEELFDEESFAKLINRASKKKVKPIESRAVKYDGEKFDVEVVSRKCTYEGRDAQIMALRDITERKQAEEAEVKLEKLESIGTLAGGIAHDFNNILLGVFANISMVQKELPKNNAGTKFLEEAAHAMNRASGLTKQLLTFAKGGEPIKEMTNMADLIEDVVKFDLSASNVDPVFNFGENIWWVKVDQGQIQQVISNLTINAKQAMSDGGQLFVDIRNLEIREGEVTGLDPGQYLNILVKDQGAGIEKENLKKIFDPYFTTKQLGSGLGLATTYSIINKHAGKIEVDSVKGLGTSFNIYLPATGEVIKEEQLEPPQTVESEDIQRILVMDDLDMLRNLVRGILERSGFKVETVEEGRQAVKIYEEYKKDGHPFDAVIMDLNIPNGLGGRETVKELLNMDPDARVIASSGYAGDSTLINFKEYGFKGVITKPYTNEDLIKIVNSVLSA